MDEFVSYEEVCLGWEFCSFVELQKSAVVGAGIFSWLLFCAIKLLSGFSEEGRMCQDAINAG